MTDPISAVPAPARTTLTFDLISAALAFTVWGGWAFYVNRESSGLTSGLIQGVGSFTIALLMIRSNAWLYNRFRAWRIRFLIPAVITVGVIGVVLVAAHTFAGTANVLKTVVPALVVAFCFNLFTTWKLQNSLDVDRQQIT